MNSKQRIAYNRQRVKEGLPLSMKWDLPSFSEKFGGWIRESYTIVTGNTGQGKTKFTKFSVLNSVAKFKIQYPNIPVKIVWFLLEESIESFEDSMMSALLYLKYDIELSPMELNSVIKPPIDLDTITKEIEICQSMIDEAIKDITFVSHISNGTGIYKECVKELENVGTILYEEQGDVKIFKEFVYDNPEMYFFVVVDNYNFLTAEKRNGVQMDRTQSVEDFSKHYASRYLKDKFKCVVIGVQQQASETERVEYYKGEAIVSKLEPTLNGLGISKNTQQDATFVIGIFNPMRYNTNPEKPVIPMYRGYDVMRLQGKLSCIIVLKDRHFGMANKAKCLYFNGATNHFEELPPADKINYDKYK
jgi:replicative DNA helicase